MDCFPLQMLQLRSWTVFLSSQDKFLGILYNIKLRETLRDLNLMKGPQYIFYSMREVGFEPAHDLILRENWQSKVATIVETALTNLLSSRPDNFHNVVIVLNISILQ